MRRGKKRVEIVILPEEDPEEEIYVVPQGIPVELPVPLEPVIPEPYEPAIPEPQKIVKGK